MLHSDSESHLKKHKKTMIKEIRGDCVCEIKDISGNALVVQADPVLITLTQSRKKSNQKNCVNSSMEPSICDTYKHKSDIDWHLPNNDFMQSQLNNLSQKTVGKSVAKLKKNSLSSRPNRLKTSVNERVYYTSTSLHDLGLSNYLAALCERKYQPDVSLVDCCKLPRYHQEIMDCRICAMNIFDEVFRAMRIPSLHDCKFDSDTSLEMDDTDDSEDFADY